MTRFHSTSTAVLIAIVAVGFFAACSPAYRHQGSPDVFEREVRLAEAHARNPQVRVYLNNLTPALSQLVVQPLESCARRPDAGGASAFDMVVRINLYAGIQRVSVRPHNPYSACVADWLVGHTVGLRPPQDEVFIALSVDPASRRVFPLPPTNGG